MSRDHPREGGWHAGEIDGKTFYTRHMDAEGAAVKDYDMAEKTRMSGCSGRVAGINLRMGDREKAASTHGGLGNPQRGTSGLCRALCRALCDQVCILGPSPWLQNRSGVSSENKEFGGVVRSLW